MKGKADISNQGSRSSLDNDIYIIAYNNKYVGDIKRESRIKNDSIGHESVDFETGLSKAGYGKFNYLLLLLTLPAASSSSWVTGALSFVLPVAGCDMNLTSLDKAWLISAPYAGMVVSAFCWGFLSDTFGRQRLLTIGFVIDSIMGMCSSISPSLWPMVFFKFMSGVMVCGPYSIFMAYLSEVFADKHRNFAVSLAGIFSAIGNIFQPIFAWVLIPMNKSWTLWDGYDFQTWRLFLIVCSIPSMICGVASAFCVESPKFLLEKGRKEEALNVFKTIYSINTGNPQTSYPVHKLHDVRSPSTIAVAENQPKQTFLQTLKTGLEQALSLFKPPFLFRGLFIFFIQLGSVTSLNVLRLWLPQMFSVMDAASVSSQNVTDDRRLCILLTKSSEENNVSNCEHEIQQQLFLNMIYINLGTLCTQCFYAVMLKFFHKRRIISFTTAIAAACVISIPLVSTNLVVILTTCIISVLNITFFCVIGCVVDIFPTTVRATSVSLTMMFGRIGILLANVGVASIMYTHCDAIFYTSFTLLSVIAVSSLFLSAKPIPVKSRTSKKQGKTAEAA